ncbi:MAG: metal ABC transporter solute-binding protein, Zn/Mn family [Desulfuromonadaceae bacterium]
MHKRLIISCFIAVVCLTLLFPTKESKAESDSPGLKLVASVEPQAYLLNKLKSENSTVIVVIRPGQNPTTWDPSPRQMQEIVSADIMFPIGVPFEHIWLPRLRQHAPDLVIADTLAGIERFELEHREHNGENAHQHGRIDPHIWLDPLRCISMAENMAATLQQQDPQRHQFYADRLQLLRTELEQLHQEISDILEPLQQRTFMVFHPSWGYFAARYNLKQIALEKDGKEPSGAHLARMLEEARRKQIKVIFVQEQFSTKAAQTIAAQTGAHIETLDPLAADLAESLRQTARTLARSLSP